MSRPTYRAVFFDLFGTLIRFEPALLPKIVIDGRRRPSTLGIWGGLVEETLPGVGLEAFARAVFAVSLELDHERTTTHIERPSRERFHRALVRLETPSGLAHELAPLYARAHMRAIADITRFPAEHAQVLADARRRGATAVITNFDDTATAYDILGRHGILAAVDSVVVSEAVGLRKPHGVLVRLALRDVAVAAAEAIMVGDHAVEDVGAAAAAGVDAVWIDAEGIGVADGAPQPRYVVRALPEVTALLA